MVMGLGMRTVWISLRALNYTDRAFRAAIINLDKLAKAERDHVKMLLAQKEVARMQVQVNLLYAATLSMMAGQLFNLMAQTEAGATYMSEFNQVIKELKVAFADTFFEILRPVLDVMKAFAVLLRDNEPLRKVIGFVAILAGALVMLYFTVKILTGIYQGYLLTQKIHSYLTDLAVKKNIQLMVSNKGLTISWVTLGAAIKIALGSFALFMGLGMLLGKQGSMWAAVIIGIAMAVYVLAAALKGAAISLSILTWGAAAIAGLAAVAMMPEFAGGTRAAPFTGPMWVHKGEIIYNPRSGRPAGVRDILGGEEGPRVTNQEVNVTIENLHTKAEFDDLDEEFARINRRRMRRRR